MLRSEAVDFVVAPPQGSSSQPPTAVLLLDLSCDASTLEARIGKVEGFGDIGKEVLGVVKAKVTIEDKRSEDKAEAALEKGDKKSEVNGEKEAEKKLDDENK